jgi:hypothetical protein
VLTDTNSIEKNIELFIIKWMNIRCLSIERITFPAGGIAAVVLATVVVVMVVAKMICVATGYESRLPNVECGGDNGEEDENQLQKRIYTNSRSSLGVSSPTSDRQVAPQVRPAATDPVLVGMKDSYALLRHILFAVIA